MELGSRVIRFGLLLVALVAPFAGAAPQGRQAPASVPEAASEPPAAAAAGAPRVVDVELELPPGTDATGFAELVSVHPGRPLSPRELRRSIERLWKTGRLSDLEVRGVREAGGVRVVFVLTPVPVIVGAAVEGNVVLSDRELLSVAGFTGAVQDVAPESLPEAAERVRRLYVARGYEAARVVASIQQVATGAELLLSVDEGPPTRVASVVIEGAPQLPQDELQRALGLKAGDVLEEDRLDQGLERLVARLRQQGYRTTRLGEPREERTREGVHLVVTVEPGPQWEVRFLGNRLLPGSLLSVVVGGLTSDPGDQDAIARAVERLQRFYQFRGFFAARVSAREHRAPGGDRALLVFDIVEDLPWLVREVRFSGREAIAESELRGLLQEQLRSRAPQIEGARASLAEPLELEGRAPESGLQTPPPPDPGSAYVEDAWREAAEQLTQLYRGRGYLAAQVQLGTVQLDFNRRTVSVVFDVDEGPLARLDTLDVHGLPPDLAPSQVAMPRPGVPFTPALGEQGRSALDDALARQGYVFAQVEGRAQLSADGTRAQLRYDVLPGPQVRVGRVLIRGLQRSDEALVRRQLPLSEGVLLDPDQLRVAQRNLLSLGHFRQVTVRPVAAEVEEPVKDVLVEVRERPRAEGQLALGYFVAEGPRVLAEVTFPNFFQTGFTLQTRARANYVSLSLVDSLRALEGLDALGGQGSLSLVSPRVSTGLGQVGTRLDAVAERVFRPAFTFSRVAGVLGGDLTSGWFSMLLQGEVELDDVDTLGSNDVLRLLESGVDPERGRFPNGQFALWALRTTATADFRDDPTNTRAGSLITLSAELMDDFFAVFRTADGREEPGNLNTLKLSGSVTGYVPIGDRMVLAASLRGGNILGLSRGAETIAPRRFFLGGWASMRGFREDGVLPADLREEYRMQRGACRALVSQAGCTAAAQLLERGQDLRSEGGNQFVLGKLELRLPLVSSLDLGIFGEAGNLWLNGPTSLELTHLRWVAGAGLRLRTPVGPVAFDMGFNLFPDREVNEQTANFHFSIGLF